MVAQARPQDGRTRVSVSPAEQPAEAALIVVLSAKTVAHVGQIAQAAWDGPVLAVGSVEEARALLENPVPSRVGKPAPRGGPARPHLTAAPAPAERLRGLVLDPDRRKIVHAGQDRTLTPLEFGVLEVLMQRPGQVHRFGELSRLVWGTAFTGDSAHLHAVVRRLRRKLEGVRAQVELVAVRGVGFRLTGLPTAEDPRVGAADDPRPLRAEEHTPRLSTAISGAAGGR